MCNLLKTYCRCANFKLGAHMPGWIRSHLDRVCILRRIRPHQAGPEHNGLSKFNANDHNNTLNTVIRETCQAENRKPSSSRAWRLCPAETTCSFDTSTTDTIQFEPGYIHAVQTGDISPLSFTLSLRCIFSSFCPWVQTQNALSISVYPAAHLFLTRLWGVFQFSLCVSHLTFD